MVAHFDFSSIGAADSGLMLCCLLLEGSQRSGITMKVKQRFWGQTTRAEFPCLNQKAPDYPGLSTKRETCYRQQKYCRGPYD